MRDQKAEAADSVVLSRPQAAGALRGAAIGTLVGAVLGALVALLPLFEMELAGRVALLLGIGAFGGAVVGAVLGGGQTPIDAGTAQGAVEQKDQ